MARTLHETPSKSQRPLRAPLAAAGLALDWATLALLGVATLALAVSTRLPARRGQSRAAKRSGID